MDPPGATLSTPDYYDYRQIHVESRVQSCPLYETTAARTASSADDDERSSSLARVRNPDPSPRQEHQEDNHSSQSLEQPARNSQAARNVYPCFKDQAMECSAGIRPIAVVVANEPTTHRGSEVALNVPSSAGITNQYHYQQQQQQQHPQKPAPKSRTSMPGLPLFKDQAMEQQGQQDDDEDHDPVAIAIRLNGPPPMRVIYANRPGEPHHPQVSALSGLSAFSTNHHKDDKTNHHHHHHLDDASVELPAVPDTPSINSFIPVISSRHIHMMNPQGGMLGPAGVPQETSLSMLSFNAMETLQREGFPNGLIRQLTVLKQLHAVRYWIVDNSGSMWMTDCQRCIPDSTPPRMAGCSRWDELCRTLQAHATLAALLDAPTTFIWLNPPGPLISPAEITVQTDSDAERLRQTIRNIQPEGATPLTQHIRALELRIHAAQYDQSGQKAVVVIATDGLPTNVDGTTSDAVQQEFIDALRMLGSHPVWIVIRLCTNDREVIQYYRTLDKQLEFGFGIEVIDDYVNEAKHIDMYNNWLGYGLPLHLCREMGFHVRLFDFFNERSLTLDEVEQFARLIFGDAQITHGIHHDYKGFCSDISKSLCFSPIKLKAGPWIDTAKLKREGSMYGMLKERMNSAWTLGK